MKTASDVLIGLCMAISIMTSAKAQFDPFDSSGAISWDLEKLRLDNFAIQLQHDSNSLGYIIVYAGRRACIGEHQAESLPSYGFLSSFPTGDCSASVRETKVLPTRYA